MFCFMFFYKKIALIIFNIIIANFSLWKWNFHIYIESFDHNAIPSPYERSF